MLTFELVSRPILTHLLSDRLIVFLHTILNNESLQCRFQIIYDAAYRIHISTLLYEQDTHDESEKLLNN